MTKSKLLHLTHGRRRHLHINRGYLFVIAEMLGPSLSQGSIYVGLFSRGDGTFHWCIAVALDEIRARKFHATNLFGGAWIYETADDDIGTSSTTFVMVCIGWLFNIYHISLYFFSYIVYRPLW
jgi:hypothetical protein